MTVLPLGEFGPVDGEAYLHHLSGKVTSIRQIASCHCPVVGKRSFEHRSDLLVLAKPDQCPFCIFSKWVIQFGRINSRQSDSRSTYVDRVTVDNPALSNESRLRSGHGKNLLVTSVHFLTISGSFGVADVRLGLPDVRFGF